MLCNYECGQEGIYQLKNGRICCSEHWQSCPENKKKFVENHSDISGDKNPSRRPEVAKKIGDSHKGRTKENDGSVKSGAEKKIGRTKENDEGRRITAEKLTGRTKETYEYIRIAGEKHSRWMKKNGSKIRKLIKRTSKGELRLRGIVKELYPTSEHTFKVLESKGYEVDNAIVKYKIAIEYDGWYHFDTVEHKEYHKKRQQEIEEEGWKFLRYNIFQPFPTLEQVKRDMQNLLEMENT